MQEMVCDWQLARKRQMEPSATFEGQASGFYSVSSNDENEYVPLEKRVRLPPRPKVCLRCLAGESGHITHVLQEVPK
ncbi:unnamed protein product, partial [Mesorhabditis spiculigera]